MDIAAVIQTAKLGRARKDAQEDTCAVFAAALYDVLSAHGVPCQMVTAIKRGFGGWAHAVVKVDGRHYDSMGEFSADMYRTRAKLHPKVSLVIDYQHDFRDECYEPEFDELHAFYVKMLNKAVSGLAVAKAA